MILLLQGPKAKEGSVKSLKSQKVSEMFAVLVPSWDWNESDSRARRRLGRCMKGQESSKFPTQHVKGGGEGEQGRDTLGEAPWTRSRSSCANRVCSTDSAAEVVVQSPWT